MKEAKIDQHFRFIRVVSRRFRQLADINELLQTLAYRPQTYAVTPDNEKEMFAAWQHQLAVLGQCFDADHRNPQHDALITTFAFTDDPVSEKNARFIRVATKRLNRLFRILSNLCNAAFAPYISTSQERTALMTALNKQYETTRTLFLPQALTSDLLEKLDSPVYRVLGLNLNGKAGKSNLSASLKEDVLPALDELDEAPDLLAFNELHKTADFAEFVDRIEQANYRVITDPRPAANHENECLLAFGPRLISLREKLPVYYPDEPTGCDYLATVLPLYSGVKVGIASIRLHPALTEASYQAHRESGDLSAAGYMNMATDALPHLEEMIQRLTNEGNADIIVILGDHNHARIISDGNYSGLDQEPASEFVQRKLLAKFGLVLQTPANGGSFIHQGSGTKTEISDDHVTLSSSIQIDSLAYRWLKSKRLDHAAVCAQLTFPTHV
ncbi:hypothetical protein [Lactobacillus sp. HBUAS51381]|uniref:hypothetical protein n=1 Tax=Lactobacillus sp. HBUAS51381 TaxID=2722743 RepID=UPI0014564F4A|nr:hypothetical protein [Lactobacillus sp. HBUAS51381]NLR08614.1 hypothetical protein [Lactobacillus sp. HBUAS51381]